MFERNLNKGGQERYNIQFESINIPLYCRHWHEKVVKSELPIIKIKNIFYKSKQLYVSQKLIKIKTLIKVKTNNFDGMFYCKIKIPGVDR